MKKDSIIDLIATINSIITSNDTDIKKLSHIIQAVKSTKQNQTQNKLFTDFTRFIQSLCIDDTKTEDLKTAIHDTNVKGALLWTGLCATGATVLTCGIAFAPTLFTSACTSIASCAGLCGCGIIPFATGASGLLEDTMPLSYSYDRLQALLNKLDTHNNTDVNNTLRELQKTIHFIKKSVPLSPSNAIELIKAYLKIFNTIENNKTNNHYNNTSPQQSNNCNSKKDLNSHNSQQQNSNIYANS